MALGFFTVFALALCVASEIKPKFQRVLFKDNEAVSNVNPVSDPLDDELVDADGEGLVTSRSSMF